MKPIKEVLGDTTPKTMESVRKALEKGASAQYADAFLAEATGSGAVDFPKDMCLVTSNYFCSYKWYWGIGSTLFVIPIEQISCLYRSCMDSDDKYDFKQFYLNVELKNGNSRFMSTAPRNAKTMSTLFSDVISCVRGRMTNMEV